MSTPLKGVREAGLPLGFQDVDFLWSPDSKSFFVNGGNGGCYWGFWVYVYLLSDEQLEAHDFTQLAQRDMVNTSPPCEASYLGKKTCKRIEANPEYNMTGIDWIGSSSIMVMAEAPCSGQYGGIMCQVMGYELEAPTGQILKRLNASELKRDWQKSMAWKFEIPDPPEYRQGAKITGPGCDYQPEDKHDGR